MIIESFITFMNKIMLFSSFVDNASGFPKPLPSEEEKEYIRRYRAGDLKAKEILISHNLRLVAHIVKKYSNSTNDADDLISVGSIGLIKAINTYEPDKGTQLSTYAARCIENEILMLFRMGKKHKNTMSLDESLGIDKDGNEISLVDVVVNEEPDVIELVESNILTEKLISIIRECLNDREFIILSLRYGLNGGVAYTQREVAKKLGISRSYISRLEKRALEIVRAQVKAKKLFAN